MRPPSASSDFASAGWDWLPTFCDLAGVATPAGLDGVSLVATLTAEAKQQPHDYLYWEFHEQGGKQAVRRGPWKAVRLGVGKNPDAKPELYNLDNDPGETTNLADETKDKPQLDAADQTALDRITNQQATSAAQTKQLSGRVDALRQRLNENKSPAQDLADIARDVTNDLDQAAENPMKEATNRLSAAGQPQAKPEQRSEAMAKANEAQEQANLDLQRALDRMANIGTLAAFVAVCIGVIVLRSKRPDLHRPFKTPFMPVVPILGVLGCLWLMSHLGPHTWMYFLVWMTLGLIVYFLYSMRSSVLARQAE